MAGQASKIVERKFAWLGLPADGDELKLRFVSETVTEYAPDGRKISFVDEDGRRHAFRYDADGDLYEEYIFGLDGSVHALKGYMYDEEGRLSSESWDNWDNRQLTAFVQHTWIEKKETIKYNYADTSYTEKVDYDRKWRPLLRTIYSDITPQLSQRYKYDSSGDLSAFLKRSTLYQNGVIRGTILYKYGKKGLVVSEEVSTMEFYTGSCYSQRLAYRFTYRFDSEGQWIRREKKRVDGAVVEKIERLIEYYDI